MYKKEQGVENNVYCDRRANMPQATEEVPRVKEQLCESQVCALPLSSLSTAREQEQKRTAASIAVLYPCSDKPLTNPLK